MRRGRGAAQGHTLARQDRGQIPAFQPCFPQYGCHRLRRFQDTSSVLNTAVCGGWYLSSIPRPPDRAPPSPPCSPSELRRAGQPGDGCLSLEVEALGGADPVAWGNSLGQSSVPRAQGGQAGGRLHCGLCEVLFLGPRLFLASHTQHGTRLSPSRLLFPMTLSQVCVCKKELVGMGVLGFSTASSEEKA